jgi:hypothetical protein
VGSGGAPGYRGGGTAGRSVGNERGRRGGAPGVRKEVTSRRRGGHQEEVTIMGGEGHEEDAEKKGEGVTHSPIM